MSGGVADEVLAEKIARAMMRVRARLPSGRGEQELPVLSMDPDFDDLPRDHTEGAADDEITQEAVLRLARCAIGVVDSLRAQGRCVMEPEWIESDFWALKSETERTLRRGIVRGAWAIRFDANPTPGAHILTHIRSGRRAGCFASSDAAKTFAKACDMAANFDTEDAKTLGSPSMRDLCEHWARLYGLESDGGVYWWLRDKVPAKRENRRQKFEAR